MDVSSCTILALRLLSPGQSKQGSPLQILLCGETEAWVEKGIACSEGHGPLAMQLDSRKHAARLVSDIEKCLSGTGGND